MANTPSITDRLADVYTWLQEPDFVEEASLEWLMEWMNRRPIAEVAMIAMLMPAEKAAQANPECEYCRESHDPRVAYPAYIASKQTIG